MHAQRDGFAHRCSIVLRIEPLLVEAVADFVQDAEECIAELVLVVAGGDPAIAWPDARAERVGSHVQPPALEVKADRRRHGLAEDFLSIARIKASQHCIASGIGGRRATRTVGGLAPGCFGDGRDQRHELALQRPGRVLPGQRYWLPARIRREAGRRPTREKSDDPPPSRLTRKCLALPWWLPG